MRYEEFLNFTVYEVMERITAEYGEKPLISYEIDGERVTVSYNKFFEDCMRVAQYFKNRGLKGKHILIDARNHYEQVVTFFASMSMGAVGVLVNFDLSNEDISDAIERISPSLIVYDEEDADFVFELCNEVLCISANGKDESIKAVIESDGEIFKKDASVKQTDICAVLMTSGSTSKSKLVMLSHGAFLPRLRKVIKEKSVLNFPLYHVAGIQSVINDFVSGVHMCLSDFRRVLYDVEWFESDSLSTIPMLAQALVKRAREGNFDVSRFKEVITGGAPMNPEAEEYLKEKGVFTASFYGATETGGMATVGEVGDFKIGSVGKPGYWNEIKISEDGEILIKGPNVMLGYLDDEDATAEALKDGWYHTGDVGRFDDEGYLFITGRIKNIIIMSNGENVSPEAVEKHLYECSEIEETVVTGKDDIISAHIFYGEEKDEEKEVLIRKFVKQYNHTVPSYHKIKEIVFCEKPFERTASNKIKRTV